MLNLKALDKFSNTNEYKKIVNIGTSRNKAPLGSIGNWLQNNVTKTAIASYVGPILTEEGYARKVGKHKIEILK